MVQQHGRSFTVLGPLYGFLDVIHSKQQAKNVLAYFKVNHTLLKFFVAFQHTCMFSRAFHTLFRACKHSCTLYYARLHDDSKYMFFRPPCYHSYRADCLYHFKSLLLYLLLEIVFTIAAPAFDILFIGCIEYKDCVYNC